MVALPVRGEVAPPVCVGAPPLGVVAPLVRLGVRVRVRVRDRVRIRITPSPPRLHGRKRSHSRLVAACRASTQ